MRNIFRGLLLFCFLLPLMSTAQAPTTLYVSKQTGQYTSFEGGYSKSTDKYEEGHTVVSVSGPIQYSVDPSDMTIAPNQSKSWTGKIWADPGAAPEPGQSAQATLTAVYHIKFSRPQGSGGGGSVVSTYECSPHSNKGCNYHSENGTHEIVAQDSTMVINFVVESINVTAPDTIVMCTNSTKVVAANGTPANGNYSWTASGSVSIEGAANQDQITLKSQQNPGTGEAVVTYAFGNVTVNKKIVVVCIDPEVILPDTIRAAINQQITITPRIRPSGSVRWSVSAGLQLNSGPYNYVAFITCRQGGVQTATATVTVCGRTITRNVVVLVNPCLVTAPDTVYVLKDNTTTITANGNIQGTYAWTVAGNISIQGGANTQTVTVKGDNTPSGTATVTFTADNCTTTKTVFVKVLQRPTVTITPQWSNTAFGENASITVCKGERRMFIANGLPEGGTYSWAVTGPLRAYGVANNYTFVFEATGGGSGTVTVTYTKDGQTATASVTVNVTEVSRIDITANNNNNEIPRGTAVTYTATVYNQAGQDITNQISLHWKVVYIPVGQRPNVGNWVSYDLQGNGNTQNYTWSFPQGNFPLVGNAPYKMDAWIEAVEYCTYKSGSKHIKVVSNNGQ